MNNRGISAVVATVLIILITVATVTIIWATIIPLIQKNVEFRELDSRLNVETSGGFTSYDSVNEKISVQVLASGEESVKKMKLIVYLENGETVSEIVDAPELNQKKVYIYLWNSDYENPVSVAAVPIFEDGEEGRVSNKVDFLDGNINGQTFNIFGDAMVFFKENMVSYWNFDDSNANDESGNGNDGVINGATWISEGKIGGAYSFNGANDYIKINGIVMPISNFTIVSWVKLSTNTDEQLFMISDGSGNNEMMLKLDGYLRFWLNNGERISATGTPIGTGQWYHIAVTKNGSDVKGYVNGNLVGSASYSSTLDYNSCPLLIGADADSGCAAGLGNYFNGIIDEFIIYDKGLSQEQIMVLYNNI